MGVKSCQDCGARVYRLGCVNCNEDAYVKEQEMLTEVLYPAPVCTCRHDSGAQSDCAVHRPAAEWAGYPLSWGDEG